MLVTKVTQRGIGDYENEVFTSKRAALKGTKEHISEGREGKNRKGGFVVNQNAILTQSLKWGG